LKVEISKGKIVTKEDILATVRISIEELVEKSANINQPFPLETTYPNQGESSIKLYLSSEKL